MKQIFKLIVAVLLITIFPAIQVNAESKEEITLTVSSDGPTKDDALKNALRTAIEQAYGAFVSANTTILNDELVKDEIVTVSNGSIKEYKEISSFEKPDGSGYGMTVNATVSLPHLITYAKNHGSECEFAGNTFGMELKLFNLQKENELKALYNAIPEIENLAKKTMHWELKVDEPKVIDYQFKFNIKKSTEYKKGGGWSDKLPYGYEQAWGELITSDAKFDSGDPFYFETKIDRLLNKPVKRPDGLPSVEQDKEILDILNEMQNGQCALVRFKLSWLPNKGAEEISPRPNDLPDELIWLPDELSNKSSSLTKGVSKGLSEYIESLFISLSIDYETANKYKNQGHDLCMNMSGHTWGVSSDPDYSYYHFRNSRKDFDLWTDSVMTVINKVKNSFEIIDNTGQVSSFNPLELSQWIYQHEQKRSDNLPEIKYKRYDCGAGSTVDWDGASAITTYRIPSSSQKITTFSQSRHGSQSYNKRILININGEGLFHNVSCLNYYGDFLKPLDTYYTGWGEERTKTTWITYIIIPLSDISKYSSFKVVAKD